MATLRSPFRYDFVGSFLRPQAIKTARAEFKAGEITREQLTAVENEQITLLIEKQKRAGYHAITDGEFRRSYWHLDFMWGFAGIDEIELTTATTSRERKPPMVPSASAAKSAAKIILLSSITSSLNSSRTKTASPDRRCLLPPSCWPSFTARITAKNTVAVYPDHEQLLQDIAAAYRTVIRDLYNAGCRSIQFDDCTWGMFCDPNYQAFIAQAGVKLEDQANEYLRLNNLALEGRPADLALTTHVCRGNYHSTWASRGGYAPIAPILFAHENVDAFYLEFDDERSGNFEPLQYVAEGKKVVLGLITTKSPRLEDKAAVIARIHEAEKYIPLDRLCLSPQCGFASCEIGNKLTDLEQWNKLKLVKEIAEEVWG